MKLITPEYINQYISFEFSNKEWKYSNLAYKTMPDIQAEGTAKLWNLLEQYKIALLADEVGMGKTYQALAVMISLWLKKPAAKVIIYAPNKNVALKWKSEYEIFIREHYKFADDKIKSSFNNQPVRQAIYCDNQMALLEHIDKQWVSLLICKTSSLSNFNSTTITDGALEKISFKMPPRLDDNASEDEKRDWMLKFALKSNVYAYKKLGKNGHPPFDLMIFDEAHYLRNADAHTNKAVTARAFFSRQVGIDSDLYYLADKTLLLTATPNHSGRQNINAIISIFSKAFGDLDTTEILEKICVRRFRRLSGKTKHQYRKEHNMPVDMTSIKEKLFFAMYQRALVKNKAILNRQNNTAGKGQNAYRVMTGYLEGFEFLPNESSERVKKNDEESSRMQEDFYEADDSKMIKVLGRQFADAYGYGSAPSHPKYDKIIETLSPFAGSKHEHTSERHYNLHPDKKLIFVRRIASVKELSNRLVEKYDDVYFEIISNIKGIDISKQKSEKNLRKYFNKFRNPDDASVHEVDDHDQIAEDMDDLASTVKEVKQSKFYALFTVKKDVSDVRTTDCSNFRVRFSSEYAPFSLFFQPPADYVCQDYKKIYALQNGTKSAYIASAKEYRFKTLTDADQAKYSAALEIKGFDKKQRSRRPVNARTLMTIWLKHRDLLEDPDYISGRDLYSSFSVIEKEAFSHYLQKGILFASGHLVQFYAWFKNIDTSNNPNGVELYHLFCKEVKKRMIKSGLAALILNAVSTFQVFYKKELNRSEENLLSETFNFLNHTSPVFPVYSETNRKSILQAFNTPFYPNVLVATSVLQEGVDLHYHCNEVIHYGLAWTQGDNEQRVGRVDRLNGKMEIHLQRKGDQACLPIYYPYLRNTLDQEQTARFLKRKRQAEHLIDKFETFNETKEIVLNEAVDADMTGYFNEPVYHMQAKDPFPVNYKDDFVGITHAAVHFGDSLTGKTILKPVLSTLSEHYAERFVQMTADGNYDKQVFAIRKYFEEYNRHQPLIAEFDYYEPGIAAIGRPVYLLRLKTPVYNRGCRYDHLGTFGTAMKARYAANPMLKICRNSGDRKGLKMYVGADLPLFYDDDQVLNLTKEQILHVIEDLLNFADDLEWQFNGNKDIKNYEVIPQELQSLPVDQGYALSANRKTVRPTGWNNSGAYLKKESHIDDMQYISETFYEWNHEYPFIKYYHETRNTQKKCVGFYREGALLLEADLYEFILKKGKYKLH
ncbi:DEAD/DEAH box helicase family protein [Niabella sp. 22666]|uniref:helicase C-terminal domain-containing protein n=1 Tax=Niabella sp. 22666 TaxID=3453954 RepID=UPI003F86A4B7